LWKQIAPIYVVIEGEKSYLMEVNKGTRIINFTVDVISIMLISGIVSAFLPPKLVNIAYSAVYFFYYLLFELMRGQTLGKIITCTIVVNMTNSKPSFVRIFFRTVLRFNPFDSFSYLFGQEQGGHDLISKTRLIKVPEKSTNQSKIKPV